MLVHRRVRLHQKEMPILITVAYFGKETAGLHSA